jgi:hypothetical protein
MRETKAMELRLSGASFAAIGNALGITEEGARKAVVRALQRAARQRETSADLLRPLEMARLDAMQLGLWKRAREGHEGAIDRVLRIMAHRAQLAGLAAPTHTRVELLDAHADLRELTDDDLMAIIEGRERPDSVR